MKLLLVVLAGLVSALYACDLTVHVRSETTKNFFVQITAPNGDRSARWSFTSNRQKETFHERSGQCVVGEWGIELFNDVNALIRNVRVTLDGVGRVSYSVNDQLDIVQVERQGATCTGQCAPLATTRGNAYRPVSRFD